MFIIVLRNAKCALLLEAKTGLFSDFEIEGKRKAKNLQHKD